MSQNDPAGLQRAGTTDERIDLDQRTVRALTEPMTVLPDTGRAHGADDLFLVVSASGSEYLVDVDAGRCECPDDRHNQPSGGCKHRRRVAIATGSEPIPAWVSPDAVDSLLGRHTSEGPRLVATDGAGPVAPTQDDDGHEPEQERPDGCSCLPSFDNLPCWPCFRDGFETPNPEASDDD